MTDEKISELSDEILSAINQLPSDVTFSKLHSVIAGVLNRFIKRLK